MLWARRSRNFLCTTSVQSFCSTSISLVGKMDKELQWTLSGLRDSNVTGTHRQASPQAGNVNGSTLGHWTRAPQARPYHIAIAPDVTSGSASVEGTHQRSQHQAESLGFGVGMKLECRCLGVQ
ncbi:hypothetical protein M404DRAFT_33220 [Pisolithus tinctorius Marx 270]|uniref:Uncharacterized protein n=1 Tax=Pisolithus tinctorius Marx 270 TaxID=870435 RepID=A0A0C3JFW2_PISTI|nr:hypothetical protein M404DRAFT_33220 [Pisolithus tinctorius Marx 270]